VYGNPIAPSLYSILLGSGYEDMSMTEQDKPKRSLFDFHNTKTTVWTKVSSAHEKEMQGRGGGLGPGEEFFL